MRRGGWVLVALGLLAAGSGAPQVTGGEPSERGEAGTVPSARPEDVRRVLRGWDEALADSDLGRLGELLEEDVVLLPSGRPPLEGRQAVLDAYRALFAQYQVRRELEISELEVAGDWAFVRAIESFELRPVGSGEVLRTDPRRLLCLLRRDDDGAWRFARAMTNRKTIPSFQEAGTGQKP